MTHPIATLSAIVAAAVLLAGCATGPSSAELDRAAEAAIRSSFRDEGIAKVDRLNQDLGQKACSTAQPPTDEVAERVMAQARADVKWPPGGRYLGRWQDGEKLAQSGRGMTWTDASADPSGNGGSCYNCHQLDPKEIAYGTIGPSLAHYGRNRGVADPYAATAKPILEYTWMKIYNGKTYNACSNMPRFGHAGLLNAQQLADVMAYLLDPKSPVNAN